MGRQFKLIKNQMNKVFKIIIGLFLLSIILIPHTGKAEALKPVNIYFFYGDGCPHCAKEEQFLQKIINNYPQVNVNYFEVWNNSENITLLALINKQLNLKVGGVPFTIIGDQYISGFLNEQTTGKQIQQAINQCLETNCPDKVAPIINQLKPPSPDPEPLPVPVPNPEPEPSPSPEPESSPEPQEPDTSYIIDLPIIGQIDATKFSLPLLTIIIAALDGFNPCAMWILLFLISLLIGMTNKKRMWALGMAFIIASGFVYFLFLTAWLNLFLFIGFIKWVRIGVGAIAIASGVYHLHEYYINRPGCKVIKNERRDRIFTNLKFITQLSSFWLALVGIIIVAFAVNLIELVCSAGLPAIYTNVLALSNLPSWQYYLLLLLYILIFMLDDLVVFVIAMLTLQASGLTHKYTRISNLVGGIIILILGILLILKPELLMFS